MKKPSIEYISACAWCEVFEGLVQALEKEYEGKVYVKVYKAGKDFDYIPKYGAVTKSMGRDLGIWQEHLFLRIMPKFVILSSHVLTHSSRACQTPFQSRPL